jgi:hypothetical protein
MPSLNAVNCPSLTVADGSTRHQPLASSLGVPKISEKVVNSPPSCVECELTLHTVDGMIPYGLQRLVEISGSMITKLGAVMLFSPIFVFPGIFIALIGAWCGRLYMRAQLSVKREMSNARGPVLGHFGAAIAGLSTHHSNLCSPDDHKHLQYSFDQGLRC